MGPPRANRSPRATGTRLGQQGVVQGRGQPPQPAARLGAAVERLGAAAVQAQAAAGVRLRGGPRPEPEVARAAVGEQRGEWSAGPARRLPGPSLREARLFVWVAPPPPPTGTWLEPNWRAEGETDDLQAKRPTSWATFL